MSKKKKKKKKTTTTNKFIYLGFERYIGKMSFN